MMIGRDWPFHVAKISGDTGRVRDFLTKSAEYLDYLPEAVARVLRQVRTEHRLAQSEARLAGIVNSANSFSATSPTELAAVYANAPNGSGRMATAGSSA